METTRYPAVRRVRIKRPASPMAATAYAAALLCTGTAHAQTAPPPADAPAQQIVVTGIRKALDTSLDLKRQASGVVDGIVAEDIGKFPDTNLAESLQRISGVAIDRSPSGEGSKITVRGVGPDFNLILLNGRQMPTGIIGNETAGASGSRAFDFANLSSDSVSALEVFKTSRASTPTGGIGATVDIKTARPLDVRERVIGFGAKLGYDSSNGRLPDSFQGSSITPELSGIFSDTFANGTLGLALSGSYSKRNSGSNKAYTQNGWRTFAADSTDWGSIPPRPATGPDPITNRPTGLYSTSVDMRYSLTALERERVNGQVTLQYAPSKDLKFTLDHTLANNTTSKKNAEMSSWFNFSFGPSTFTSGPVASPLIQTALFPSNDHDLAISSGEYGEKSELRSTGLNTEWKVSADLKLELDAHHSTSTTRPNSPFGTYALMNFASFSQGNTVAYYDKDLPLLQMPGTVLVPSKQLLTGSQFNSNLNDQGVDQAQVRGTYKLGADSKLNAGLGFTRVKNRAAGFNNVNNDWGGVGQQGDYASVATSAQSLGGFFSQIAGANDPRLYPNFYRSDFQSLRARAIEVLMRDRGLTRAQAEAYFAAAPDYSKGNDWRTTETSSSAFVQWDLAFDAKVPMNLSVGLRYEGTKVKSSSQIVSRTSSSWNAQNEVVLDTGPTTFGEASGKYSYVLPSIDWDADLTTNLKVRASYGENIGRPGWGALTGGVNLDPVANAGGGTGATGNPGLKPLHAKNLDFSAEYYYARSSYVSVGAFYKKVTNFIGTAQVNQTVPGLTTPIGGAYYRAGQAACAGQANQPLCIRNYIFTNFAGQPGVTVNGPMANGEIPGRIAAQPGDPALTFRVNTPSNSSKGDSIKGLELNVQHAFGNSGFGMSGNLTWVRTGLKFDNTSLATQTALVGVGNSANLVGFFENDAWSVRAAYNWRGQFLAATSDGAGNNPVYTEAYGQLDASIGYKLGKSLTIQADLLNLNDGYIRQHGRTPEQLQSVIQTGRRILVGARYSF